jgi:hypothetical protein
MKELAKFEQPVGGDGAMVGGAVGVEGEYLTANVKAKYPIAKIVEPAAKVIDELVDKVEKLLPGDQTGLAAELKAEARAKLVKALSEGE